MKAVTTPWQQLPEPGSFVAFGRTEVHPIGEGKERDFLLFLEEVNKDYSRPFNWRFTISENNLVVSNQTFYLNVTVNSPETAKLTADRLTAQYIQGLTP